MTTPPGWTSLSLAVLADGGLFVDGDWVETKDQDTAGTVRLTQLADVGVGEFRDRSNRWMREDQAESLSCTRLLSDDILIARMPDPLGRACLVPAAIGEAVTAVDVAVLRIRRPDIDCRYVMWAINSPQFYQAVRALEAGTTRKRISRRNLATLFVPVPPLPEQRHIVDLLEDHLSRLEAGANSLQAATTRADSLLRSGLHELWCRASDGLELQPVGAVAKVVTGSTPREAIEDSQSEMLGFLTPGDVGGGQRITTTRRTFSALSLAGSRATVGPAAYAVCIGATLGKVGWCAQPLGFNQQINAVLASDANEAHFLATIMASPRFQEQMRSEASATTMPILNKSRFCALELPMPPAADRDRLLARFEDASLASHRLRQAVAAAQARRAGLRRALMAAAFSGRLTGTNHVEEASDV